MRFKHDIEILDPATLAVSDEVGRRTDYFGAHSIRTCVFFFWGGGGEDATGVIGRDELAFGTAGLSSRFCELGA